MLEKVLEGNFFCAPMWFRWYQNTSGCGTVCFLKKRYLVLVWLEVTMHILWNIFICWFLYFNFILILKYMKSKLLFLSVFGHLCFQCLQPVLLWLVFLEHKFWKLTSQNVLKMICNTPPMKSFIYCDTFWYFSILVMNKYSKLILNWNENVYSESKLTITRPLKWKKKISVVLAICFIFPFNGNPTLPKETLYLKKEPIFITYFT